jgi:outer membrane protein assembly factor BamE (lipoprotein component of BamABCDE complex)
MSGMRRDGVHSGRRRARASYAAVVALALTLGGCFGETFQRGYVLPEGALEQIRLGASREQVLIVLGTPSTVATVSGEAFYYISQRAERSVSFMPAQITDQRVIAIYFDKDRRVERVASYGMKDGKVFDYISRTTPTAATDLNIVKAILQTVGSAHIGLPF